MNKMVYAFLLSSIAGLSTLLGTIPIFGKNKNKENIITSSLAFAAGVMICVSFTDLLPESFTLLQETFLPFPGILVLLIFFSLGVLLSIFIDRLFPQKTSHNTKQSKLYRVGFISMIAIIAHNLPEGIATFLSASENAKLGLLLTIAIALHNIPEGISIAIPIFYSTKSKRKAFLYTLLSGMSEPLGALLAFLFLSPFVTPFMMGILLSIIAGIMIHIAVYELLPESISYHLPKATIFFFLVGTLLMYLSHILM